MLSTAADLAAALVKDLPPDVRKIEEAHFFDGESIFTIQRRHNLKSRKRHELHSDREFPVSVRD